MLQILSDSFRLLAACFYFPDKEVLLDENVCRNLKDLMEHCCPKAAEHCLAMEQGLIDCTAEKLQTDHAALFVGPFELIAPPYGSVYLDGRHMLMGDSTMEVQQLYRLAGLSLTTREVPDHITLELEFASYLTSKIEQHQHAGNDAEAAEMTALYEQFLRHHLGRWVPGFCQRVQSGSGNAFYCSLTATLETFIFSQKNNASVLTSVKAT